MGIGLQYSLILGENPFFVCFINSTKEIAPFSEKHKKATGELRRYLIVQKKIRIKNLVIHSFFFIRTFFIRTLRLRLTQILRTY